MKRKIGGIQIDGLEQGEVAMSHYFGETYYHAFRAGICYEIGEGIATSGHSAVDGLKKIDEKSLFAILDSIVDSIAIRPHYSKGKR